VDELEVLRVRDEVLQAMYWMRSEGIAETCSPEELSRFLAVPAAVLAPYLRRFTEDGLLLEGGGGYELSATGSEIGKRAFADEFAGLTGASHGECDENCWCHDSPEAAATCLEERRGHVHS
jgi:hypothetical protein